MQEIIMYAVASSTLGAVRDYANAQGQQAPTFSLGSPVLLRLRIFDDYNESNPYPIDQLSGVVSWQAVFDHDFAQGTTPVIVADNANIVARSISDTINGTDYEFTEIAIPLLNMNTQELAALLGDAEEYYGLHMELVGFDALGAESFLLQVKNFTVRNRIYYSADPTPISPDYLTASQVRALIAAGFAIQYSADGETWHDTQASGDQYIRIRSASDASAAWSSAIAIPSGAPGKDGEDGASAYDIWLTNGHEGTEADFLEWLKGADGSGVNSATATTLSPGSAATVSLVDGALNIGVPRGNAGASTYTYVAFAEDSSGTGFSLEPSNTRKYRAEIHVSSPIATPTASDFAGATWVKYIGEDGDGAFTADDTFSSTSENAVQNKVIKAKLDAQDAAIAALQAEVRTKQPTLSYDTAPTPNSNNPVTSGGIYAAIQAITPGGGGDSIADENVVSPIDSIATIKDYYDNAQHGFAEGIQKIMVCANANTDSDTELKQGHAYAVITLPEAITTETITIWQWTISWTATTRLHLMTTAEAEEQEHDDIYGRFGGDYYRDETGGGWLRDDRAWRIISGTLSGDSTPQYVIVPGNLKWDTMSFGDIYSGIQAIETDPGHIDGKLCGTAQPGTVLTDYEPHIGGRVVRRVYTMRGLTILIHDITPCVCGSCPLEARIAALENA